MRKLICLLALLATTLQAAAAEDDPVAAARARWETSPHGELLRRILPPSIAPAQLPEPQSAGARLTVRYCVQCHHLVNPAMHDTEKWPPIVARMLPRMQGRGNMGVLMKDLMAGVAAPSEAEARSIAAYLSRHGQRAADIRRLPEAGKSHAWTSYTQACSQCHATPDPRRHTRGEWPGVVARMEANMQWMNRVVGSTRDPREPQYRSSEIIEYLQKYARQ